MAWHEPDDKNKKDKDPWTGNNQSPPDLDELFRSLQQKVRQLFRGKRGGPFEPNEGGSGALFGLIGLVAICFWALSGIFIVAPAEQAVILRFGKYVETVGPGPHWIPRFIEQKYVRNVELRSKYEYSAQMLTKDENIVQVAISVMYRIGNLEEYLFNVTDPQESLKQATASALRQVAGHTTLDQIITEGREVWGGKVEELLRNILAKYKTGIIVVKVSPQPARAPEKVQDAFDDAITAREDEKRYIAKAKAYSEKVLPIAKGQAKRIFEESLGKAREWVLQAEGDVAEFLALLPQFKQSPQVLRERMYIDSIEQVLSQTTKILVDKKSGNVLYLPLQELLASKPETTTNSKVLPQVPGGSTEENTFDKRALSELGANPYEALRQSERHGRYGRRF